MFDDGEKIYFAEVAQLVEHNLAKVRVAGSSPVFRSQSLIKSCYNQLVAIVVARRDREVLVFYKPRWRNW